MPMMIAPAWRSRVTIAASAKATCDCRTRDAAVVGVPHKTLGEEVKAVVQLRAGATADADAIRDFCRKHLADFKVPEYVEIRAEPLPRNPAGKVLKQELRGETTAFVAADDQTL